ncbi:MAG TPA: T9SS type A sorting domain-containing protein [Candidatus Deferrimicrobium sp.]|nr:T9SS type A sorting domain-containing protein [Candidatus Deferrimicrobium sp.]
MMQSRFYGFIGLLLATAATALSQEVVHPTGYTFECSYNASDSVIAVGDTLTINRTFINNESFAVTGLYFSDNLPSVFSVVGQSVRRNGVPITVKSTGPYPNLIAGGYSAWYWIVDSPDSSEQTHNTVFSGDTIVTEIKLVSQDIGDFVLPLHTTAWYGSAEGFFATSPPISVRVTLASSVDDDPESGPGLPDNYLMSRAFPNPFNAAVAIYYSGRSVRGRILRMDVYDLTGRVVVTRQVTAPADEGVFLWDETSNLASGIYFYLVSDGSRSSSAGKLLLLK